MINLNLPIYLSKYLPHCVPEDSLYWILPLSFLGGGESIPVFIFHKTHIHPLHLPTLIAVVLAVTSLSIQKLHEIAFCHDSSYFWLQ